MPACRLCTASLDHTFVDLGVSPPCETYLEPAELGRGEMFYPLHVLICSTCLLVQLPNHLSAEEIFSHYAYFSSFSDSWVRHAERFVERAVARLDLGQNSFVVEVASNDGYLLQHVRDRGIRALGVEPAANVAAAARDRGVETETLFLGEDTGESVARRFGPADLVVANNVLAHVPDIVDFARGLRRLVADHGSVSIEVPHLLRLIEGNEFDTIYHEHYSYLTLLTTQRVLATAGLSVVDVEELTSHGGSLRTWSMPSENAPDPSPTVAAVLAEESARGLHSLRGHGGFAASVAKARDDLVGFLVDCSRRGRSVAAYGAPGKGNTLLNYCGVRPDQVAFAVDRNPFKHGKFLPGTRIPIYPPERLAEERPDFVIIMPWNLRAEISEQLAYVKDWGGALVVALPQLEIISSAAAVRA